MSESNSIVSNTKPGGLNVKFVEKISQHSCLWNYNSQNYFNRESMEKAWNEIATQTSDTVPNCQMRWKSIRQAFARSLKPTFSKKKDYYLAPYLSFLVPYLRRSNSAKIMAEQKQEQEKEDTQEGGTDFVKAEEETMQDCFDNTFRSEEEEDTQEIEDMRIQQPRVALKRRTTEVPHSPERKEARLSEINANKMFLQSLSPFLNEMTSKQNRRFRRKVMSLIDEVLEDEDIARGDL